MPQELHPPTGESPFLPKSTCPLTSHNINSNNGNSNNLHIDTHSVHNNNDSSNSNTNTNSNNRSGRNLLKPGQAHIYGPPSDQGSIHSTSLKATNGISVPSGPVSHNIVQRPNTAEPPPCAAVPHRLPLSAKCCSVKETPAVDEKVSSAAMSPLATMEGAAPTTTALLMMPHTPSQERQAALSSGAARLKGVFANRSYMSASLESRSLDAHSLLSCGGLAMGNLSTPIPNSRTHMNTLSEMDITAKSKAGMIPAAETAAVTTQNPFAPRTLPQAVVSRQTISQNASLSRTLEASVKARIGNSESNREVHKDRQVPEVQHSVMSLSFVSGDSVSLDRLVELHTMPGIVKHEGLEIIPEQQQNGLLGETQPLNPEQSEFDTPPRTFQCNRSANPPKNPTGAVGDKERKEQTFFTGAVSVPIFKDKEELGERTDSKEYTGAHTKDGEHTTLFSATLPLYINSSVCPGFRSDKHLSLRIQNESGTRGVNGSGALDAGHSTTEPMLRIRAVSRTAMFERTRHPDDSNKREGITEENVTAAASTSAANRGIINGTIGHANSSHSTTHSDSSYINSNSQIVNRSPCTMLPGRVSVHSSISSTTTVSGCFSLRSVSSGSPVVRPDCQSTDAGLMPIIVVPSQGSCERTASVPIENEHAVSSVKDMAATLAFHGDQPMDYRNINTNIISELSAHEKDQQWLQVPALFYLIFNLIKLREVQQQQQQQKQHQQQKKSRRINREPKAVASPLRHGPALSCSSSSSSSSSSCLIDSLMSLSSTAPSSALLRSMQPSPRLLRRLHAQISLAVLNLRRVLLSPHLTRWSDSGLRRAVATVADAWESNGPQSAEFEKASFHLLNLVSSDCGGRVTHRVGYPVWRFIGSTLHRRTLFALYAAMLILVISALVAIGWIGNTTSVRIALSVIVGVVTTILAIIAVIVIDHNEAASKVAERFEVEMMNYVAEATNMVGHDTDFRNHTEMVHPHKTKGRKGSSGRSAHKCSQFETSTGTCPMPSAPHAANHEHEHCPRCSFNSTCRIDENESGERVTSKIMRSRSDIQPLTQISPSETDAYNEVTDRVQKNRLNATSCYRDSSGADPNAVLLCDDGEEVTNVTKGSTSPYGSRNTFTNSLLRASPEALLDDDRYNALLISRLSFQQQQMVDEHRQDLMLRSHITKNDPRFAMSPPSSPESSPPKVSIGQGQEKAITVVDQEEENTAFPPLSRKLHIPPSLHVLRLRELRFKESNDVSPNSCSLAPLAASRLLRDSMMSSGLIGLTVTALVYSRSSAVNLGNGVLDRLWSRNFLVLQRSSLEALDAAFQRGSERFKVFLLHAPDLDQEQLRIALSWALNQRRPVFFFSAALSTMSSEIPYAMRLEMPLTARDVDTVLLSGIGVDEEMSCVSVFRPSKQFKVPPYTLGRRLGGGAFGNVFEAEMEVTGARCAVKRMYLRAGNYNEKEAHGVSEQLKEIAHEVGIMSQLCHPNIVQYLFCERDANCVSIFMELCPGGSLSSLIACGGLKTADQVKRLLLDIIGAVSYLHGKHIVHRDLKPENVLFRDGLAKVSDFGTAVLKRGALTNVKGTFGYMAPEVLVGETYGKSCDVWSIGCIAAEVLGVPLPHRSLGLPGLSEKYRRMAMDEVLEVDCDEPVVADFLRLCLRRNPQARSNVEGLLELAIFTPDDVSIEHWMTTVAARRRAQRKWTKETNGSRSRSPATAPSTARDRGDHEDMSEAQRTGDEELGKEARAVSPQGSTSAMSLRSADLGLRQTPWQSPMSHSLHVSAPQRTLPPQEKI